MKTQTKTSKTEATSKCLCGCGKSAHSNFLPGHDARLHSVALKIARGEAKLSELPKGERVTAYLSQAPWMTPQIRKALGLGPKKRASGQMAAVHA